MVEVYDFIRAYLLLLAGRKENIDLPFISFVCVSFVFCLLEKPLSIFGFRLSSLVGAQSLADMLFFPE